MSALLLLLLLLLLLHWHFQEQFLHISVSKLSYCQCIVEPASQSLDVFIIIIKKEHV